MSVTPTSSQPVPAWDSLRSAARRLEEQGQLEQAVILYGRASAWDDMALLLTELERHDGVVLLAANLVTSLDAALARRLGWTLAFELPEVRARAGIWRRLLPPTVPGAADIDVDQLAASFRISGAAIRNAVVRAAFRADRDGVPLTTDALGRAVVEGSPGALSVPPMLAAADT